MFVAVILLGVLQQGKGYFLFRREFGEQRTWRGRWKVTIDVLAKCIRMLLLPLPFAVCATLFWRFNLFDKNVHLHEHFEGIATAAWIAVYAVFYGGVVIGVLMKVWDQYLRMREAVKDYNIDEFMKLRDEELSPLFHLLMFMMSVSLLAGFMSLKFPDMVCGLICISGVSYLEALIFFVIVEIDDPCGGVWVIKSIPREWLVVNAKEWRKKRDAEKHAAFLDEFYQSGDFMFDMEVAERVFDKKHKFFTGRRK